MNNDLLYVGSCINLTSRFAQHLSRTPWFAEVEYVQTELYRWKVTARASEERQIIDYQPKYNSDFKSLKRVSQFRNIPLSKRRATNKE